MSVRHGRTADVADPLNVATGARIAGLLRTAKLTQADLAADLGIDRAAVSRRLNGLMPWRVDELGVVAARLGVRVDELLPPQELAS